MPFPLPKDPEFRIAVAYSWADDVEDRLSMGDKQGASLSWKTANSILLSLPPGKGDSFLEGRMMELRVKLDQHLPKQTCEQ